MKRKLNLLEIDFCNFNIKMTISVKKLFHKPTYEVYTSNQIFLPQHRLWRNDKKELVEIDINDILNKIYNSKEIKE